MPNMILLTGLLHCEKRLPIPKQKYSPEIKQVAERNILILTGTAISRDPAFKERVIPTDYTDCLSPFTGWATYYVGL